MIIGICGLIGSGKDTIANHLVDYHDFYKTSFADKLKDAVAQMFDWDRDMLEGKSADSRSWREQPDPFWTQETGFEVTPRLVLQKFGTECMRQGFFDGIWVSLVKQQVTKNPGKNWVIPDVRFPNEIKMIKEVGGWIWRVKRGPNPDWFTSYVEGNIEPDNIHPSEWAWAKNEYDWQINNDYDVPMLNAQVNALVESYRSATKSP